MCHTGVGTVRTFPIESDIPTPHPPTPNPGPPSLMSMGGSSPQSISQGILVSPCVAMKGRVGKEEQGREGPCFYPHCPHPFVPHAFSPRSPHHTQQEDVLAGNPLVEVDVAQVLGGLLRSTDFLVVVDHPPAMGRRGAQGRYSAAKTRPDSPHPLSSPTPQDL